MKVKLTNSKKIVLIDNENYEWIINHNWSLDNYGYACTNKRKGMLSSLMHRLILNAPKGQDVDHINGNPLDNRRKNLRICSRSQNLHNSKKHKDNKSGYKGVFWQSKSNKWRAQICCEGKRFSIGMFCNKKDAAIAYNKEAIKLFGQFARLNKINK